MVLNDFGKIAYNEWIKTAQIRENVELDSFVIMPDHMHGILRLINSNNKNYFRRNTQTTFEKTIRELNRLLKKQTREDDFVIQSQETEFVIILPKTFATNAIKVSSRLFEKFSSQQFEQLKMAMGISTFPNNDVATAEDLLFQAKKASIRSRRTGRNLICLYHHITYFYPIDISKNSSQLMPSAV